MEVKETVVGRASVTEFDPSSSCRFEGCPRISNNFWTGSDHVTRSILTSSPAVQFSVATSPSRSSLVGEERSCVGVDGTRLISLTLTPFP